MTWNTIRIPMRAWTTAAIDLQPQVRASVGLVDFSAGSYAASAKAPSGVALRWQTGFEADNLGFNVYREDDGKKVRVNPGIIGGSVLFSATRVLTAGNAYSWFDPNGSASSSYWLEDMDLNGQRTLHGPYRPSEMAGKAPEAANARLLSDHGADQTPTVLTPALATASAKGGGTTGGPKNPGGGAANVQWDLASRPTVKLGVRQAGWYRVTGQDLVGLGVDITRINPQTIQLFAEGTEQAIVVTGGEDRHFDATDTIEFYGTGFDLQSTDTRAYWLTSNQQVGKRVRFVAAAASQANARSFATTAEAKPRFNYFSALANGEKENFFGDPITADPVSQAISLPHVDRSTATAQVEVAIQGVTTRTHNVAVALNGQPLGNVAFIGKADQTARFTVPVAALADGANQVTFHVNARR